MCIGPCMFCMFVCISLCILGSVYVCAYEYMNVLCISLCLCISVCVCLDVLCVVFSVCFEFICSVFLCVVCLWISLWYFCMLVCVFLCEFCACETVWVFCVCMCFCVFVYLLVCYSMPILISMYFCVCLCFIFCVIVYFLSFEMCLWILYVFTCPYVWFYLFV